MNWDLFYKDNSIFFKNYVSNWKSLPTFDKLVDELKRREFLPIDIRLCCRAIERYMEEVKKIEVDNESSEERKKEDLEKYGVGGVWVKSIVKGYAQDASTKNTKDVARDTVFRLVGWEYNIGCSISHEEFLQIRDILELRHPDLAQVAGGQSTSLGQGNKRELSAAEREVQSTRGRIEMMKAASTSLAEVIQARDEILADIGKLSLF